MRSTDDEAAGKLFLGLIFFLSALFTASPSAADYVRIKGTVVNVRQGPGTTFPVLFQAEQGEEFDLLRTEGLWCQIRLKDGEEAWVFGRLVEILPGERPGRAEEQRPPAEEDSTLALLTQRMNLVLGVLVLLFLMVLLLKRRAIKDAAGRKLREISGYRREQPFRYDTKNPRDDSWEL